MIFGSSGTLRVGSSSSPRQGEGSPQRGGRGAQWQLQAGGATTAEMQRWDHCVGFQSRSYRRASLVFFENDTVQRKHSQHTRTITPMNTRMQTLPLWAPPKDWAPANLEIPEVTNGGGAAFGDDVTGLMYRGDHLLVEFEWGPYVQKK
jgi:hypothetical protein